MGRVTVREVRRKKLNEQHLKYFKEIHINYEKYINSLPSKYHNIRILKLGTRENHSAIYMII